MCQLLEMMMTYNPGHARGRGLIMNMRKVFRFVESEIEVHTEDNCGSQRNRESTSRVACRASA
jgi:hypothetical protein